MPIVIKGMVVDGQTPVVCVPIVEKTQSTILEGVEKAMQSGVRMIEWRADFYEDILDEDRLLSLLEKLRDKTKNTIFLVTLRSKEQGGEFEASEEVRMQILLRMARTRAMDILDLEFTSFTQIEKLTRDIQMLGIYVLLSHHNFFETPPKAEMMELLKRMRSVDPDIVKLAVMPQTKQNLLCLLSATNLFHETYPDMPLITISMGKLGMLSRICGEFFGSCVTFGSMEKSSAPGQIPQEQLETLLDMLHPFVAG